LHFLFSTHDRQVTYIHIFYIKQEILKQAQNLRLLSNGSFNLRQVLVEPVIIMLYLPNECKNEWFIVIFIHTKTKTVYLEQRS